MIHLKLTVKTNDFVIVIKPPMEIPMSDCDTFSVNILAIWYNFRLYSEEIVLYLSYRQLDIHIILTFPYRCIFVELRLNRSKL